MVKLKFDFGDWMILFVGLLVSVLGMFDRWANVVVSTTSIFGLLIMVIAMLGGLLNTVRGLKER